jgi:hypothetical protein
MKKTLLVVLILFAVFIGIGQGQSPVIGLGGTCASISGCPALTQSNTFTQPQTFNGTNSVHINNAGVNSQIYSETPSYSYAAWVFASYGNYDALIANGTSEHVPFVGYTELTGTQPFSDTATGDVWLNAGSSRILFVCIFKDRVPERRQCRLAPQMRSSTLFQFLRLL